MLVNGKDTIPQSTYSGSVASFQVDKLFHTLLLRYLEQIIQGRVHFGHTLGKLLGRLNHCFGDIL